MITPSQKGTHLQSFGSQRSSSLQINDCLQIQLHVFGLHIWLFTQCWGGHGRHSHFFDDTGVGTKPGGHFIGNWMQGLGTQTCWRLLGSDTMPEGHWASTLSNLTIATRKVLLNCNPKFFQVSHLKTQKLQKQTEALTFFHKLIVFLIVTV